MTDTVDRPLLDVRNVTYETGGHRILDGLSLTIGPQEIHALLGTNGSGKSTLAYVIMGADPYVPQTGELWFDGRRLETLKLHERAQLGMTLAWQEPARFEGVSVRQYLTLGTPSVDPALALAMVGLSAQAYLTRMVDKSLSGGERKRIELASLLGLRPRLAMLDEPAAGIDLLSMQDMIEVIRAFKEQGAAVLLITHQEDIALIADRASQICGGTIVFSGEPRSVAAHYKARLCVRCDGRECAYERVA